MVTLYKKNIWLIVLLPVMLLLAGCGDFFSGSDITLDDIAGKWYNQNYDLVFEITLDGEEYRGYIAENQSRYTVTVSEGTVYFWLNDDDTWGSFRCSVSNGVLTLISRTGYFTNARYSSSLVKSDRIPADGSVRVELIGKWYSENSQSSTPYFEISLTGTITLAGDETEYDAIISEATIAVLSGTALKGTFQYSISRYGAMYVTSGTDICSGLPYVSPFVKRNN